MHCEWPAWAGPVSRMGLPKVIAVAAQKEEHLQFFKDKRIVKGSGLHNSFTGHIENLDHS